MRVLRADTLRRLMFVRSAYDAVSWSLRFALVDGWPVAHTFGWAESLTPRNVVLGALG